MYREHVVRLTTVGSAGSAAASGSTETLINGRIASIQIDYTSQPATTDIAITENGTDRAILTVTSANTDLVVVPEIPAYAVAGTALTYDGTRPVTRPIVLAGRKINVAVAQGDAVTNGVVVTIITED